jgi:hypothetical protein
MGEVHMWREFISGISPHCEFSEPAPQEEIDALGESLGMSLPDDLAALLRETNGVHDRKAYLTFLWSCGEIERENFRLRSEKTFLETYKPLDSLLFFGRAGSDGILFAYSMESESSAHAREIIAWVPIPDTRNTVASSLADFIRGWLTGNLDVV